MADSFNNTNALAEEIRGNVVRGFIGLQTGASTVVAVAAGSALPVPASGYGEVVIAGPLAAALALPASYPVLFDSISAPATVLGGGGGSQAVMANSGGLTYQFFGGGGVAYTAANAVGGVAATGNTLFVDGIGPAFVAAGEGHDTIVVSSGTNDIAVGSGSNQVFLVGGSNLVATEGNDQIVIDTGAAAAAGAATVSLSGNSDVYGGASPLLLLNGSGISNLLPQTDSLTGLQTNTAPVTVFGGQGGGAFYGGTEGRNVMLAGDAATTLVGGGNGDVLYAFGASSDVLQATGANTFLIGTSGTGNNTFFAGAGITQIYGGTGSDIFVTGTGNETLVAGSGGGDQFDFTAGQAGGFDVIFDFKAGIDQVNLFGYDNGTGAAAANALDQAAFNSQNGSTFVTLGDNTTIVFVGAPHLAANSIVG